MENHEGIIVDKYVPRKCYLTNRIITSKDHASVQLTFGHLDQNGVYNGKNSTIALSGHARKKGLSDSAINKFLLEQGLVQKTEKEN